MSDTEKLAKGVLVYDVCSAPDGMNIEKIVSIWKEHDFIMYDATLGDAPKVYDAEAEATLVDISTVGEEKLVEIQKLLKDE